MFSDDFLHCLMFLLGFRNVPVPQSQLTWKLPNEGRKLGGSPDERTLSGF